MERRDFLRLVGCAASGALVAGCSGRQTLDGNAGLRFTNPLLVPPILRPDADGAVTLRVQAGRTRFRPGAAPTPTLGYNGAYLGPTVRANRGEDVTVRVRNELAETSTVHWHGMRLPAVMDGGPHQPIPPGDSWSPTWQIAQPAATLWYHPHPHGETATQVYRGLAGLFLIDDPDFPADLLPHTYGVDDIPVIVQDKTINADGSLAMDSVPTFGLMGGDILINGTYAPRFTVTRTLLRCRVLNASNARAYNLGLADGGAFAVIANDAGFLPTPVLTTRVPLSPAERVELLIDFHPGQTRLLRSYPGDNDIDSGEFDLLQLPARRRLGRSATIPDQLPAPAPVQLPAHPRVRRFTLNGHDAINGQEMDLTRIDEVVPAGAREVWEVQNTVYAHNFHIHGCAFQVLDTDGRRPTPALAGPKDTVFVPEKATVRLAVAFDGYADPAHPYMYHCHLLRHEDAGMMGQYLVVAAGQESSTPRQLATMPHLHH